MDRHTSINLNLVLKLLLTGSYKVSHVWRAFLHGIQWCSYCCSLDFSWLTLMLLKYVILWQHLCWTVLIIILVMDFMNSYKMKGIIHRVLLVRHGAQLLTEFWIKGNWPTTDPIQRDFMGGLLISPPNFFAHMSIVLYMLSIVLCVGGSKWKSAV